MPHIPQDLVAWRLEAIQEGDGQLDHTEPRTDVSTGFGDDVDEPFTHFVSQLLELFVWNAPNVFGAVNGFQERHDRWPVPFATSADSR